MAFSFTIANATTYRNAIKNRPKRSMTAYKTNPGSHIKTYTGTNVGFVCFFDSELNASKNVIENLRTFHPAEPIYIWTSLDGLSDTATTYGCTLNYNATATNIEWKSETTSASAIRYLDRMNTAVSHSTFTNATWIIMVTVDTRCEDRISKAPDAHISGSSAGNVNGKSANDWDRDADTQLVKAFILSNSGNNSIELNGWGFRGGCIFHKYTFINDVYPNVVGVTGASSPTINLQTVGDDRWTGVYQYVDVMMPFIFNATNKVYRVWDDVADYKVSAHADAPAFMYNYTAHYTTQQEEVIDTVATINNITNVILYYDLTKNNATAGNFNGLYNGTASSVVSGDDEYLRVLNSSNGSGSIYWYEFPTNAWSIEFKYNIANDVNGTYLWFGTVHDQFLGADGYNDAKNGYNFVVKYDTTSQVQVYHNTTEIGTAQTITPTIGSYNTVLISFINGVIRYKHINASGTTVTYTHSDTYRAQWTKTNTYIGFGGSVSSGAQDIRINSIKMYKTMESYLVDSTYQGTLTVTEGLVVDTSTLKVDNGNNRVGMGTASPASIAHVYEDSSETGVAAGLTIEQDGDGDALAQFLLTSGQRWQMGIDNSASDAYVINVGTDLSTSPLFKLETDGDLAITPSTDKVLTYGYGKIGYFGAVSAFGMGHTDHFTQLSAGFKQTSGGKTIVNAASGESVIFRINNSEVGKFDGSNNGDFNARSGTLYVDGSTNRVGINDTSPSYGLDVSGTGRFTGALNVDSGITNQFETASGTVLTAGWYRIATNGTVANDSTDGTKASARFRVYDDLGYHHGVVDFIASINYNLNPTITLLNGTSEASSGGLGAIEQIRIVEAGTYNRGTGVDIYINENVGSLKIHMYDNNLNGSDKWTLVAFTNITSIPSQYNENCKLSLANLPQIAIRTENATTFETRRNGDLLVSNDLTATGAISSNTLTTTGVISSGGALTASGDLTVNDNTPSTHILGRAKVGKYNSDSWVGFGYYDLFDDTNCPYKHSSAGQTWINASASQEIDFRIANSSKMRLTGDGELGVGLTSPTSFVHFRENSDARNSTSGVTIEQTHAEGDALLHFLLSDGTDINWTMGIDESHNGGVFAIRKGTYINETSPFMIEGSDVNLGNGILYVDDDVNRVGINTMSPSDFLHLYISNTETLTTNGMIMEQASSGNISFTMKNSDVSWVWGLDNGSSPADSLCLVKDTYDLSTSNRFISFNSDSTIVMHKTMSMNSTKITSLATPTSDYDAATKKYVDDNAGGGADKVDVAGDTMTGTLTIGNGGDLVVDTNTLFVDASANRVGIGTTSLSAPLHIYESTTTSTFCGLWIEQVGSGDATVTFRNNYGGNDQYWKIGIDNSQSEMFAINPSGSFPSIPAFSIGTDKYVGINTNSPDSMLTIVNSSDGPGGDLDNYGQVAISIEKDGDSNKWAIAMNTNKDLSFQYNLSQKAWLSYAGNGSKLNFTGQHRCTPSECLEDTDVGLLVSIDNARGLFNLDGSNIAKINESLVCVKKTTNYQDACVYGIIDELEEDIQESRSYTLGTFGTTLAKVDNVRRVIVNGVGEGAIWVCDKRGDIDCGDLLCASDVKGYACKQESDQFMKYTVAKIAETVQFDCLVTTKQQKKIKMKTISETITKKVYETKTVNSDSTSIELIDGKYVFKEIVVSEEQTVPVYDTYDLYDEEGELLPQKHIVHREETTTVNKEVPDLDANGCYQFIDDTDKGSYACEIRYLLKDGTASTMMAHCEELDNLRINTTVDGEDPNLANYKNKTLTEQEKTEAMVIINAESDSMKKTRRNIAMKDDSRTIFSAYFVGCTYHCS